MKTKTLVTALVGATLAFATIPALAQGKVITRNKAEGIANAKTEKDCNGKYPMLALWKCHSVDLSECSSTHDYHSIVPLFWCTEIYIQENWINRHERVCHRALPINMYGRILTEYLEKVTCQLVDPKTAVRH